MNRDPSDDAAADALVVLFILAVVGIIALAYFQPSILFGY